MSLNFHDKIRDELTGKGWFLGNINQEALSDAPLCSFYCHMPHNGHLVNANISMDKFYELTERNTVSIPSHMNTTTVMINGVALYAHKTSKRKSPADEEACGLFMAMYMPLTGSGSKMITQYPDVAFDFLITLYPTNKKCTDFAGRPAVYTRTDNELLNPEKVLENFNVVMKHDYDRGKKEYFKYLKDWKKNNR